MVRSMRNQKLVVRSSQGQNRAVRSTQGGGGVNSSVCQILNIIHVFLYCTMYMILSIVHVFDFIQHRTRYIHVHIKKIYNYMYMQEHDAAA